MGSQVDWNFIQQEIYFKTTGQGDVPLVYGVHGLPGLMQEKVHYQELISAAARNFGEAVYAAVERFWHRKFCHHVEFGQCFRTFQAPFWIQSKTYDLGTTVFYAPDKLKPMEVQELKWFIRFYFNERGVELMPQDFEVLISLDRERPEWFCYVLRFNQAPQETSAIGAS